jgi:hypothetical protein
MREGCWAAGRDLETVLMSTSERRAAQAERVGCWLATLTASSEVCVLVEARAGAERFSVI